MAIEVKAGNYVYTSNLADRRDSLAVVDLDEPLDNEKLGARAPQGILTLNISERQWEDALSKLELADFVESARVARDYLASLHVIDITSEEAVSFLNQTVVSDNQMSDLLEAARPLMKWLEEDGHPHNMVLVTAVSAEFFEGLARVKRDDQETEEA